MMIGGVWSQKKRDQGRYLQQVSVNMDRTEHLEQLFHQLNVGDVVQRNNACDEIQKMVGQTADLAEKDRLRQNIIYHLIDLGRVYEAEIIIEALRASANHDMQAASCFHRIEFCKKFASDADQVESAIQEALSFTKAIGHEAAYTDANMEYGKFLAGRGKECGAITCFSDVANYAENHRNNKLLAAAKYYLGFCLYHLGHLSMANSFLREATEMAFRERNHILVQTSETLRAIVLMKQGKNDEAQIIFQQWESNFGLLL